MTVDPRFRGSLLSDPPTTEPSEAQLAGARDARDEVCADVAADPTAHPSARMP